MRPLVLLIAFVVVVGTVVTIAASPASAEESVGHLPTAEDFVTQQYEDFLGRAPDADGLTYWSDLVRQGVEPSALVESMATSAEFEGVVAPLVRLYFAFFDRPPDYDGLLYWTARIRDGVTLEQVAQQFVLSSEFQLTYGALDDAAYINLVYGNVLDRAADAGGRDYWIGQLVGGLARGGLMVAFSDSPEYREVIDPKVKATMLYVGMLRRSPERDGLDYWAGVVGGETPYRKVIAGFLGAAEYGDRMGRIYDQVHPLTGIRTRSADNRPALAVKIDNVSGARPQTALERADVIYEEMVEGSLTRLIAVFHSDLPDVVGPVRSVRTTDIDILAMLNTPLLAASGANPGVLAVVDGADVVNVNAIEAGSAYFRSSSKRAPHNLFARTDRLHDAADGRGGTPPMIFHYREPGTGPSTLSVAAGAGVEIDFGATEVGFTWSAPDRGWLRTQNGTAHRVAGGEQLAPANVVVLEVPYGASSIDAESPEAHTVGSGTVRVLTAGRLVTGTWSRTSATQPIVLRDGNGAQIGLTRGQTIVELAPLGSVVVR
ncbi:MAG: DUF4214 domain-containing protein [Actinomycetota bacterium]